MWVLPTNHVVKTKLLLYSLIFKNLPTSKTQQLYRITGMLVSILEFKKVV
jgi:hypothetical protein